MKDKRKRIRCKICKERVNLQWKNLKNGLITFFCPKCGTNGTLKYKRK